MKKCPTCGKTFDDNLKFCQTDGTPLVEEVEEQADPYKTVVVSRNDIAAATAPPNELAQSEASPLDDVLEIPEAADPMRTMVVSDEERREMMAEKDPIELPLPSPLSGIGSETGSGKDVSAQSEVNKPSSNLSAFGESPSSGAEIPKFDSPLSSAEDRPAGIPSPFSESPTISQSSFEKDFPEVLPSGPIPSPFDDSMPPGYQLPASSPFAKPDDEASKDSKPFESGRLYEDPKPFEQPQTFNQPFEQQNYGQSKPFEEPPLQSFEPPSPFGSSGFDDSGRATQPLQQTEWTPPPAPEANWQNQDIGQNTPFQPPPAAGGQNQTLAIVSLVLGIAGIVLCQLTAPIAVITGFMARRKASENPNEYGGAGLALAGIITGAIGTVFLLLVLLYFIFVFSFVASQGF